MTLLQYSCFIFLYTRYSIGQNGAVKDISNNGWSNNNHLSQIEDGLVKNTTAANFRGRQAETPTADSSGVKALHLFSLKLTDNLNNLVPGDAEPDGGAGSKDEGHCSTPETDGTLQWGCFNCRNDDW